MNLLGRAIIIAHHAHKEQFDKQGKPYIDHVRRVAENALLYSVEAGIVAWLHDVVEDTNITLDELRTIFPAEIVDAVDAITRRKYPAKYSNGVTEIVPEIYLGSFIPRIKANTLARIVKLEDLRDNISRIDGLPESARKGMLNRYYRAIEILSGE